MKLKKSLEIKFILLFLVLSIFLFKTNPIKNFLEIINYNFHKRLENIYGYCGGESIGYLKYIKKEFKLDANPEIINFEHTPPNLWSIYEAKFNDYKSDKKIVLNYPGKKIISGGTTAQIVARELNTEIQVGLQMDRSGLPPASHMNGVDLVTEGILTLSKIGELLKRPRDQGYDKGSPAGKIFQLLMQNDIIDVVVGTKINEAHQDPNLPVELEIRRNLMKKIVFFLEEHHMKEVNIQFV